jgi:hypothetical protein
LRIRIWSDPDLFSRIRNRDHKINIFLTFWCFIMNTWKYMYVNLHTIKMVSGYFWPKNFLLEKVGTTFIRARIRIRVFCWYGISIEIIELLIPIWFDFQGWLFELSCLQRSDYNSSRLNLLWLINCLLDVLIGGFSTGRIPRQLVKFKLFSW